MSGCTAPGALATWPCISCRPIIAHGHDAIVNQNIVDLLDVQVDVIVMVLVLVVAMRRAHVGSHGIAGRSATSFLITSNAIIVATATVCAAVIL